MLFNNENNLKPCGIFSLGHFILLTITFILIFIFLKKNKNKTESEVKNIIKKTTIFLWILEIIKIIYSIKTFGIKAINKYVPLYFCSLILYTGILSGFFNGKIKRIGDVFISTGGIVAGLVFLIYPLTSLPSYPMLHYISIQSFILHGAMLYLGLLMHVTHYINLRQRDIVPYSILIITLGLIAYILNTFLDSNLMFVSKNYPGTFIELIYNTTGKIFPLFMISVQATIPFYFIYYTKKIINKHKCQNLYHNII